jgi:hypothetical protein
MREINRQVLELINGGLPKYLNRLYNVARDTSGATVATLVFNNISLCDGDGVPKKPIAKAPYDLTIGSVAALSSFNNLYGYFRDDYQSSWIPQIK